MPGRRIYMGMYIEQERYVNKMSVSISSGDDLQKMIEKYNQELMRTYQRSALSQQPAAVMDDTPAAADPAPVSAVPAKAEAENEAAEAAARPAEEAVIPARVSIEAEDEWTQEASPEESGLPAADEDDGASDDAAVPGETETAEPEAPAAPERLPHPEDEIGQLQVRVFAANSAIPIGDAYVAITRSTPNGEELFMVTSTDRSGFTPVIEVPNVARELSQTPGDPTPYSTYNILVQVPGFYTVRDRRVPVYSGITSVQPVELIPLPEGYTEEESITYTEGGPSDL